MHMPTILEEIETFIVHFSEGATLVVETERIDVNILVIIYLPVKICCN